VPRWAWAGLVFVAIFTLAPTVLAQNAPLAEALEAYRGGRLDVALERFEAAVRVEGNAPEELAAIHLHLGILRATMGENDAAGREFELALAIRPDLEVPSELGPEPSALFERARAARGGRAVRVEVTAASPPRPTGETRIRVAVLDAPEGGVGSIGVRAGPPGQGAPAWARRIEGTAANVAIPAEAWRGQPSLSIAVDALDPWGGTAAREVLEVLGTSPSSGARDRPGDGTTPRADDDDDGGGFFSTAWPWIGLVVIAGAAAAAIVWLTASEEYTFGPPVVE
jgi:hypothetical protein